ncbi:MAG: peptidyl-tRNA hydrolase [Candidatus Lokiarchaeota archaeon]|nr:peptidyl-tRNA hydrolase [Candidatus Lokiarchaeota archaeon]
MEEIKQIIVIRTDLKMGAGKKCAQACHASISSSNRVRKENTKIWKDWINSGQKKVVLKIQSLEELEDIFGKLKRNNIICSIINDAGLTQLEPGTTTALGIGPDLSNKIDKITGNLKLL